MAKDGIERFSIADEDEGKGREWPLSSIWEISPPLDPFIDGRTNTVLGAYINDPLCYYLPSAAFLQPQLGWGFTKVSRFRRPFRQTIIHEDS